MTEFSEFRVCLNSCRYFFPITICCLTCNAQCAQCIAHNIITAVNMFDVRKTKPAESQNIVISL